MERAGTVIRSVGQLVGALTPARWAGFGIGVVVAAVVVLARGAGVLDGVIGLAALAALLLALPVARAMSRRVIVVGTSLMGWLPLLWWVRLPVGDVGRVTILQAVLAGGLVGWVGVGAGARDRLRSLRPEIRAVDGLPWLAGSAAALVALPWLRPGSGAGALSLLTTGWDHSAHYFMTAMIRANGVVIDRLGAGPGGDEWAYQQYPQGPHTLAAALLELLEGPAVGTPGRELVAYTQVLGLLSVLGVVVVTAGVVSLPGLRRRPALALPLVALVVATYVVGPGGRLLSDGFPNFVVACALVGAVPPLVVMLVRLHSPVVLFALGGAIVGIAHGWILLLVLVLPACVAALAPHSRWRWRATAAVWARSGVILAATGFAVLYAVLLLQRNTLTEVLLIGGGVTSPVLSDVLVLTGLALAGCLGLVGTSNAAEPRRSPTAARATWLGLVPAVGLGAAVAIAGLQISANGGVGYYFLKFAIAVALASVVVLATAIGAHPSLARRVTPGSRLAATAMSVVLAGALTQVYGPVIPGVGSFASWTPAPGIDGRGALAETVLRPDPGAALVLEGLQASVPEPSLHRVFLTGAAETRVHPIAATQWYMALTGSWTAESNQTAALVSTDAARVVARNVLAGDPRAVVVVPPDQLARVRAGVQGDGWADRVLSW